MQISFSHSGEIFEEVLFSHYQTITCFYILGEEGTYVETLLVNGENAGFQHFLLFRQCFLSFHRQIFSLLVHAWISKYWIICWSALGQNTSGSQPSIDYLYVTKEQVNFPDFDWNNVESTVIPHHTFQSFNKPQKNMAFENIVGKGMTSIFSFSCNVLIPVADRNHKFNA